MGAITGTNSKFGPVQRFVQLEERSETRQSKSGNIYGAIAHFPLREGRLYEVQCCRGDSSKRCVVREFTRMVDGKRFLLEHPRLSVAYRKAANHQRYTVCPRIVMEPEPQPTERILDTPHHSLEVQSTTGMRNAKGHLSGS